MSWLKYLVPGYGIVAGVRDAAKGIDKRVKNANRRREAFNSSILDQTQGLVEDARSRLTSLDALTPGTTARYQTGMAEAQKLLANQRQQDAGQAAMRGMAGSEMEIAQAANRSGALVDTSRSLLASSETQLEQQRERARAMLAQIVGMNVNTQMALDDRDQAKKQQMMQALSQLLQSGTMAALGGA